MQPSLTFLIPRRVELAYLNQLSRKTYSLKQDVQSWSSTSSHPSRAEDKSDDDLHLSNESGSPVRTENQSSLKQKKEVAGSISHVGSYKKHIGFVIKKTFTDDRFSSLEQKYLKKPSPSKKSTGSKILDGHKQNHGNAFHQQRAEEMKYDGQANSDKKATKSTIRQTEYSNNASSKSKALMISDESSVDEELARYLNETSLTSNQGDEFHLDAKKSTAHSFSEDCDDSMDEVLNLDNILTVEDILDQITGNESQAHGDSKYESICPGSSKNSSSIEKPEAIIRDSDPPIHYKANPVIRNESTSLNSNSGQVKGLISDKSDISHDSMQTKMHGTDKKDKSMLFSSRKSLFYSNTKQDDSDHDKPVGILLAQSTTNVFHSQQRKSSIEFYTEGSVRPKAYNSKNINEMVESEVYSEGSVKESIASYTQRSIAESVEEGDLSTSAGMDKSAEENLATSVPESLSENIQSLENTKKDIPKANSQTKESMSSKAHSQNTRKSSHNFLTVKSPSKHSSSRRKMLKPSHHSDTNEPWNISDHEESTKEEKSKRKTEKVWKKRHKKHKSKKKYRTSTSESSSSESYSDSERDWHRRRHSQSHRYKWKYASKPWSEPPYIQPWCHHYQPYATPAGIYAHSLGPTVIEGFVGLGGVLGVKEVMQQQVALMRQFLDSQQALYHAYTATLTSSYHYTSLRNTEKYIKKRKPPLTFSEAYKIVKEEMKATE
ncbi:uncharacterized protein [Panulirus ornatus]|uniref:uncharacterized protein isoform X2 n=1 Tax=Panulirus ornatus TaxID=150431 RepID=UPI003A8C5872